MLAAWGPSLSPEVLQAPQPWLRAAENWAKSNRLRPGLGGRRGCCEFSASLRIFEVRVLTCTLLQTGSGMDEVRRPFSSSATSFRTFGAEGTCAGGSRNGDFFSGSYRPGAPKELYRLRPVQAKSGEHFPQTLMLSEFVGCRRRPQFVSQHAVVVS